MSKEKLFDDLAQFAGGTIGIASGISQNIRGEIKSRIDDAIDRLDLVPRSDFERLETLLQTTIIEKDALTRRIDALEGKKPAKEKKAKAKTTKIKAQKKKA